VFYNALERAGKTCLGSEIKKKVLPDILALQIPIL